MYTMTYKYVEVVDGGRVRASSTDE